MKFWCADSLEAMSKMPDGCVDLIVTDLPYQKKSGGKPGQPKGVLPSCI